MGLIKAASGAAGGVLADQWKEYFYCEALPADTLAVKGRKKVTKRSSNTKGDENIITTGSVIAVADGQCMLIVDGSLCRAWRVRLRRLHGAQHFCRQPGREHRPGLPQHRQAVHLRRRSPQGPAGVLFQHQGNSG